MREIPVSQYTAGSIRERVVFILKSGKMRVLLGFFKDAGSIRAAGCIGADTVL